MFYFLIVLQWHLEHAGPPNTADIRNILPALHAMDGALEYSAGPRETTSSVRRWRPATPPRCLQPRRTQTPTHALQPCARASLLGPLACRRLRRQCSDLGPFAAVSRLPSPLSPISCMSRVVLGARADRTVTSGDKQIKQQRIRSSANNIANYQTTARQKFGDQYLKQQRRLLTVIEPNFDN